MSTEYRYDRESDSFRPVENKKKDTDWGSWVWIAIFFAVGLWPIGLIALISKLKDSPRKSYTSIAAAEKSETKVVKTARKVTRTPTATDGTANVLTIVGLAVTGIFGIGLFSMIGEVLRLDGFPVGGYFSDRRFSCRRHRDAGGGQTHETAYQAHRPLSGDHR